LIKLIDPINIGDLKLPNRIVMPPMATNLSSSEGKVTESLLEHYDARCEKLGLLIVECTNILPNGRLFRNQLDISSNDHISGLTMLVEKVHEHGTPIALQLIHGGGASTKNICGVQPCAPSDVLIPGRGVELSRALTLEDIDSVVNAFIDAAFRASQAGFDAVEIHGAHGYLLNQFLSPLTNFRVDEYGGSLENRVRIFVEIINGIKKRLGSSFPLLCRLGVEDFLAGGIKLEDGVKAAMILVKHGVDIIDVSGGFGSGESQNNNVVGLYVPHAHIIKTETGIPVIGVGGIKTAVEADEIIRSGKVDLVAIGRPILNDPAWALKAVNLIK